MERLKKVEMDTLNPLIELSYSDVIIKDKELIERLKIIGEFYLSIPTNNTFFEMRKKAGLDTRGGKSLIYGSSWFEEGGIVIGQWLQAYCRFYVATKDERYIKRVNEYVDALTEVQKKVPDCYICSTTYMAEKLFHGLMDAVELCGIREAYDVCKALIENFREIPAIKNAKCRLGDNGGSKDETFREIEWYTLSESLYRYADMAIMYGEEENYIAGVEEFAKKFEYDEFWNIFLEGKNLFDYSPVAGQNTDFFHAYSHLNSFNSAAYIYRRTGEKKYLEMAKKFNAFLEETQVIATGGFGTIKEWLLPKEKIVDALLHCHYTFENQCNTYATLRLNRFLSIATGDLKYGNLSELLYYNSFLSSLETDEQGHAFYYSDYCAEGGKKTLNPVSWTCCSGTRPLAAMEILKNIYFIGKDESLYINLFISSEIECKNAIVTMESDYIKDGMVRIKVAMKKGVATKQIIHIRKPAYILETEKVLITGADYTEDESQFHIEVNGNVEQKIVFRFPQPLYTKDIAIDKEGVRAFMIGPIVLAAEGLEKAKSPQVKDFIRGVNGYFTAGTNVFRPYKDYEENEEYRMHFKISKEEM